MFTSLQRHGAHLQCNLTVWQGQAVAEMLALSNAAPLLVRCWDQLLTRLFLLMLLLLCAAAQNDLMELWSLMHFLMPAVFASHAQVGMIFLPLGTAVLHGFGFMYFLNMMLKHFSALTNGVGLVATPSMDESVCMACNGRQWHQVH